MVLMTLSFNSSIWTTPYVQLQYCSQARFKNNDHDYYRCYSKVAPRALASVFDRLRSILNEATDLDKRTQYMIESAMAILKDKFQVR